MTKLQIQKKLKEKVDLKVGLQRKIPMLIKDEDKTEERNKTFDEIARLSTEIYELQLDLRKK